MGDTVSVKNKGGRPKKEFNKRLFEDLVGIGCTEAEICWMFRDERGTPVDHETLSKWCKRTFGKGFSQYKQENGGLARNIRIRQNQMTLCKTSAAMAIFLGKNYLGQSDGVKVEADLKASTIEKLAAQILSDDSELDEETNIDD